MIGFSSVQFSHSVVSDSLWPHESQHARPLCPSATPGVYSNSCPSSRWCHPAISSSVVPFSSCRQSPPSIRVFSNESTLCMRWPKYWSFSFSISPSNKHPGLISFRYSSVKIACRVSILTSKDKEWFINFLHQLKQYFYFLTYFLVDSAPINLTSNKIYLTFPCRSLLFTVINTCTIKDWWLVVIFLVSKQVCFSIHWMYRTDGRKLNVTIYKISTKKKKQNNREINYLIQIVTY